jgi:hypothetical protein
MATENLQMTSPAAKAANIPSIAEMAWTAAWAAYKPIRDSWDNGYDEADRMPAGPDREAAFATFYKVNLPEYQRARDELMRIPAPSFPALLKKMQAADAARDEHYDQCLEDMRRLVAQLDGGTTA